jgi:hypothetical protein
MPWLAVQILAIDYMGNFAGKSPLGNPLFAPSGQRRGLRLTQSPCTVFPNRFECAKVEERQVDPAPALRHGARGQRCMASPEKR